MSERSRLPDSLGWRAVGWMEMGLSQDGASRRLYVSRSVVQHLWNQYQTEASVSRRHVPGQPRATTPAGDRFIALSAQRSRKISVPQFVADHFVASGRRISASTTSPDSQWRAIQNVCSSGGNEAPNIINPTLLKDIVIEVVEQGFGQESPSVVALTCLSSREEL
ncbi:transposable element Tcb2 transposase [Trichonephila clavipes]|nr:transposable element Tcb2 transposase [Trichonephila clavipes]